MKKLIAVSLILLLCSLGVMASDTVNLVGSLQYNAGAGSISNQLVSFLNKSFTLTGTGFIQGTFSVPTTAGGTALPLGGVTTPGWYIIINLDPANTVDLLPAVSGTGTTSIPAMGMVMGYFKSTVTAPAMLAHTAAVTVEYLISQQ